MTAPVCNLEARGIRIRLRQGYFHSAVFVALVIALFALHAPRASRWVVFLPVTLASIGYLQAWTKTCVLFASQNVREAPTDGMVSVADRAAQRRLRTRSIGILAGAIAMGAAVAAVAVAI